jgi:hypothetical protein
MPVFPPGVPFNETQVIQTALTILGYPIVQSIDAGGPAAQAMQNMYGALMAADLSSPNWRFATKVATLSQVAGVNPNFMYYNSEYQLPPDCLAIWQIWPGIPYEVFGERIWTFGSQNLQIQYRAVVPPHMLPAAYVFYFCYLLACSVAPGVTDDPKVIQLIKDDMTKWRSQAMIVNTQGRPNQGLAESPWVNARPAGSFYGTSWST